jgi:hypothetical protein
MCTAKSHVRFTPKSGHVQCGSASPLWAKSGHGTPIRNKDPIRPSATSTIRSAIVKMGQILFIFCARDYAAFLLNAGAVFSWQRSLNIIDTLPGGERCFARRTRHIFRRLSFRVAMHVPRAIALPRIVQRFFNISPRPDTGSVCSGERGLGMELSYEHELFGANPHLLMLLGAGLRQVRAAQGTRRPVEKRLPPRKGHRRSTARRL